VKYSSIKMNFEVQVSNIKKLAQYSSYIPFVR